MLLTIVRVAYILVLRGSMQIGIQPLSLKLYLQKSPKREAISKQFLLLTHTYNHSSMSPTLCSLHKHHLGVVLEVVPAEKHLFPP